MTDQNEQSGCAAIGSIGGGAIVLGIGIALLVTAATGGLAIIPIAIFGVIGLGLSMMGKGAGTVATKAGQTDTGKAVVRGTKSAAVTVASATEKAAIKSRARRVIGQLQEQMEAGAISEEEFAVRAQSVLSKAGLDLSALDSELSVRIQSIKRRHS